MALAATSLSHAAAPMLYRQPAYQSPVRGAPDDLLLLAGYGFQADDTVVYQSIRDDGPLKHPDDSPASLTADLGTAEVVSKENLPHSLTIKLPEAMRAGQAYALWVRTAKGEWSEPVRINDARPYWVTPAYVYATERVANLPRAIRVVGRNLEPVGGAKTQIKLTGPANLILDARPHAGPTSLDHFVAEAHLPERLPTGHYTVQLSRDGTRWVDLVDQVFEVREDPASARSFEVGAAAHGGCRADDGQDDAPCILRAIERAKAAGGGAIVFGPGVWTLSGKQSLGVDGIVLARGVSLIGAGMDKTRLVRAADWARSKVTFTLLGRNTVRGFSFRDERIYTAKDWVEYAFLKLGPTLASDARERILRTDAIEDVVITDNRFERTHPAIHDAALPLARLFITYNEFGSYANSVRLAGSRAQVTRQFRLDDSVIRFNVFKPGSYLNPDLRQGALAGEIGAGHRLDFSNNTADGTSTEYLYSPEDAKGWRAGFFWHMANNHEQVLVAENVATCTGDKVGDGELISYDNSANAHAFDTPQDVIAAGADTVTVPGPLRSVPAGFAVPVATYYVGHWIQLGAGPGLGQVRKIQSYEIQNGAVTFKVSPQWDVVPVPRSTKLSVGREYWQVYTVANTVDNRRPLCLKSNRSDAKAGGIVLWGLTADSVVEGNRQFDSDGIVVKNLDSIKESTCRDCERGTNFINFVEIRGNYIDGEYDWENDCSSSGIFGSLGVSPGALPLTGTYGLSISHNVIRHADGWRGGAISFAPTWFRGPSAPAQPLVNNILIHHNTLTELDARPARSCHSDRPRPRRGISIDGLTLVARTVLYANDCASAPHPVMLAERGTTKVCPKGAPPSCGCPR